MVGPIPSARGGVSSVIAALLASPLAQSREIQFIGTSGFGRGVVARFRDIVGIVHACAVIMRRRVIVHVHMSSGGSYYRKAVVLWWAALWRRKTLIHLHGGHFHTFAAGHRLTRRLVKDTFEAADVVGVLSPEWGERVRVLTGLKNSIVLPNPVTIPAGATRGELGVVFLGKLGSNKGTPELLSAVRLLQERGTVFPVVLAGDGDVEYARKVVASLPHPEVVSVPGWVGQEEVRELLERFGVFCLPSFDEGKPIALLQAMSYGLACVTTPVGGIPDVVSGEVNGVLVPPGEVGQLASALQRVLSDEGLRSRLGAAARESIRGEYDVNLVAERLDAVYTELESGSSPHQGTVAPIHRIRTTYESLPRSVRRVAGTVALLLPVKLRYGTTYGQMRTRIQEAEWADEAAQKAIQEHLLRRLVSSASAASYWRGVFEDSDMPHGPRTLEELADLPLMDRGTLQANLAGMMTPRAEVAARKWVTTGGTSGRPLGLWIDKDASVRDWAFVVKAWERVGFHLDERRVVLRGLRLGDGSHRALTEYEPIRRELYVSTFDLDREHLPEVRKQIASFRARYVHGYPSAMEVLGKSYLEAGETPPHAEALLAVSENLYPGQRETLERLFNTRVFSFYGMTEKAAFAAECEHSAQLHVEPLYGYLELVAADGSRVTEPGIRGEIVVTGFLSKAVPLIRYRTGDFAAWAAGACACGRAHPRLESVEGRWIQEYLVGSGGAKISMTAINVHSAAFDAVQRFTFVQDVPGEATLRIEPAATFDETAGRLLLSELQSKLAGQVVVELEIVDRLPYTPVGKHRFIDQRIPSDGSPDA